MTLRMVKVPRTISPTMTQNPTLTGSMRGLLSPVRRARTGERRPRMLPVNVGFWVIVGLIVLGTFTILSVMARLYRKVGPNQALIVYGLGGTRVFSGRGAIV